MYGKIAVTVGLLFFAIGCGSSSKPTTSSGNDRKPTGQLPPEVRERVAAKSPDAQPDVQKAESKRLPVLSVEEAQKSVDGARKELERLEQEAKEAREILREFQKAKTNTPESRQAARRERAAREAVYEGKRALKTANRALGDAEYERKQQLRREESRKKNAIRQQVKAKKEEAAACIRNLDFEGAKAIYQSIADISGGDERSSAAYKLTIQSVEQLQQRRQNPELAAECAAKDKLILTAAQESVRLQTEAFQIAEKIARLKKKREGKSMTEDDKQELAERRDFIEGGRLETTLYGQLQLACADLGVEEQGGRMGTRTTTDRIIDSNLEGVWQMELRCQEETALSSGLSSKEEEAVRRGVQERFFPELLNRLATGSERDRVVALSMIRDLKVPAAMEVPAVAKALKDPNQRVRLAAAQRCSAFGADSARLVPALVDLLGSQDAKTRKAAVFALSRIGPPAVGAADALKKLVDDPEIGSDARRALDRIGSNTPSR